MDKNTNQLSPMTKLFYNLKSKHPDAVILFRTGGYYLIYEKDAEKASAILGITLIRRSEQKDIQGNPLAMAGFPHHSLNTYLPKLIRAGERVAICDQIEVNNMLTQHRETLNEQAL